MKLKMKKIELIALLDDSKKIIELLQRRGIVELSDCRDEKLIKLNTGTMLSLFEKHENTAVQAHEILLANNSKKKPLLSMLNGRTEFEKHDFGKKAADHDKWMQLCIRVTDENRKINENTAAVQRTQLTLDSMKIWKGLDIPLNFSGTRQSSCFIGTLPGMQTAETVLELIRTQDETLNPYIEITSSFKEQSCIVVMCSKDLHDKTYSALREIGFVSPADAYGETPAEIMSKLNEKIISLNKSTEESRKIIQSKTDYIGEVEFVIDYLAMRRQKYEALQKLSMSRETFMLTGYIPEKYSGRLISELEKKYPVIVSLSDPDEENDDVPVLLENNGFAEPVEGITEMYALPGKHDVDPNGVMSFFYYLFFGMMLSDAGYGVIMVIATTLALTKTRVEGTLRRSLKMFQYCGISTIIWGALFGSWFGDIVQVVSKQFFGREMGSLALWFEPIKDPVKLLLFSFALGIVHLFVGLGVNFWNLWKQGKKLDAVCDVIPVYLTVLGVCPLGASILTAVPAILSQIGGYVAIAGVILIVLTAGRSSKNIFMRFFGGLYGLYNTATGYLSDILSYSRLLALGLATGSIASVINLIGSMPSNTVIKAIMLTIVFIVGHTANIAINMLGAYVHADRLQFVEMFSKFYEGGGRAFEPLRVNTKYIKFKEEN